MASKESGVSHWFLANAPVVTMVTLSSRMHNRLPVCCACVNELASIAKRCAWVKAALLALFTPDLTR